MVGFARVPIGIDVDHTARVRPAAFRAASLWCDTRVTSAAQWTQIEALWKAIRPLIKPGMQLIPAPAVAKEGWQLSRDEGWWLFSSGLTDSFVWTLATARNYCAESLAKAHQRAPLEPVGFG